jgi:hypothetical protein
MPQRLSDVPLVELVPETRDWNEGRGIELASWISGVGGFEHAIGYGELFWPDFVEHGGGVFFAESFSEESYGGFMRQTGDNLRAVESVMNHRHILDLFCDRDAPPSRDQIIYVGRLLKEIWGAKLQRDFPDRRFAVSFPEEPSDDLLSYEITFFQDPE